MTKPSNGSAKRLIRVDPFIVALVLAAGLGFVLPARGEAATAVGVLTKASIALLFFFQGVRLQRDAVISGLTHWRLQLLTLASTFVLFPLLGIASRAVMPGLLDSALWLGVLYLCVLPSTVQSSIAFTAIAKGNVPAAICAATASNLLGIVITPLLVAGLLGLHGGTASPLHQIQSIVMQLLVPFIAGQIASRWLRPWATRHPKLLTITDRGSIILVVYAAFSAAVLSGVWEGIAWVDLLKLLLLSVVLLGVVLTTTTYVSRALRFTREDEISIVFCGSKKSLATGVPMANVLFPAATVGLVILPVMLFHQLQLIVCAFLARRYAERAAALQPQTGTRLT
ncbi:MAG: bile acid:sodium symporter [Steroidobacteraceae bacterium]|nr:bile acid:sodium symporter [Steroidobacteraceae bacterium]